MSEQPAPYIASGLVAMVPVANIERSASFYAHLGFAIGNRVPQSGTMHWAWLYMPGFPDWRRGPNLMLTRSDCPIEHAVSRPLYYLYVANLPALHNRLTAAGLQPGAIHYPDYLPKGECAIEDPDGNRLMLAQSDTDTP